MVSLWNKEGRRTIENRRETRSEGQEVRKKICENERKNKVEKATRMTTKQKKKIMQKTCRRKKHAH